MLQNSKQFSSKLANAILKVTPSLESFSLTTQILDYSNFSLIEQVSDLFQNSFSSKALYKNIYIHLTLREDTFIARLNVH